MGFYVSWIGAVDERPAVLGTNTGEVVEGEHSLDDAKRLARLVRLYYAAGWPAFYPSPNDVPVVVRAYPSDEIVERADF